MLDDVSRSDTSAFFKSLGFPSLNVHHSFNHFDFTRPSRRILVIGPMGSGKTEYSARVWRDSLVAGRKDGSVAPTTATDGADRRNVFVVRSALDAKRFPGYPDDALAFRGGFERCGDRIASIRDSFELEELMRRRPDCGCWIIDEASFYDERLAYVVGGASERRGLVFVFPTLILNFRKEIFNATARFLLDAATDVFPLTAYCEHPGCLDDSFYTYRYYRVDGVECPALYFDPLIVIGGDRIKEDPSEPNYCTRCDRHHHLPGKEYTFMVLKPLGQRCALGDPEPLAREVEALKRNPRESLLYRHLQDRLPEGSVELNSLKVGELAEKALVFLFAEQNLLPESQFVRIVDRLGLDRNYLSRCCADNQRAVKL